MDYAAKHAQALLKFRDAGAAVQFTTGDGAGVYDPATDTWTDGGAGAAVAGHAVEIPADPEEYAAQELIPGQDITLLFTPDTFGETPALGSRVMWAGKARTVKQVAPIRPAGSTIAARIVVS